MQSRIIYSQPANHRLILIFAGWSTTPAFYRDLHASGWDIAVVWDYTSLDFDPSIIEGYPTVFLIGWSMGVAAAAHAAATTLPPERISAAFAVNGTLFPASDKYGIPEDIYEATRATLNPRNLLKFTKRMGYQPPANMPPVSPEDFYIPDIPTLQFELQNIRDNALRGRLPWKRAYVSTDDRIFPPSSMHAAWEDDETRPTIIDLNAPHYVHLQRIIDEVTPNLQAITRRFQRALPTYDDYASAQSMIACRLSGILKKNITAEELQNIKSMVEIGPGTGLLTYQLAGLLFNLNDATFVDLYQTPFFDIANEEIYITEDAEKWIHSVEPEEYDLIASANTIQWFADPATFFSNAARILKKDGLLLCSTFLPGNLAELDARRPSPLLYRSPREIEAMLTPHFDILCMESSPITLTFRTRRELLIHLQLTGVGGGTRSTLHHTSPSSSSSPSSDLPTPLSPDLHPTSDRQTQNSPLTLTYQPLYFLCRRKAL